MSKMRHAERAEKAEADLARVMKERDETGGKTVTPFDDHELIAKQLLHLGWTSPNDAQWDHLREWCEKMRLAWPTPAPDALARLSKMADDAQVAEEDGYGLEWDGKKLAVELRGIVADLTALGRPALVAPDALREAFELMKQATYQGHSSHWDSTGGHGAGCPACIETSEKREKAQAIWNAALGKPAETQGDGRGAQGDTGRLAWTPKPDTGASASGAPRKEGEG